MTHCSKTRRFPAGNAWPRRALPCLVPGSTRRIPPRASPSQKICPPRRSSDGAVITNIDPVRDAASAAVETASSPAPCTTSATWCLVVRTTFTSCTRNITKCKKFFNADTSDYALPKAHYTHRVVSIAVRLAVEDGLPYQSASWHLWRDHRVFVPYATIQNWVEAGGEKGGPANVDEPS